jgi:hypothetical protein
MSTGRLVLLLLLLSRSEGFSRILREALSTETPVTAGDLDQTADLIRRAGRVAPVEDVDSIAARLNELFADPALREQSGGEGRRVIMEEGYSWESSVEETTNSLARLVRARRPGSAPTDRRVSTPTSINVDTSPPGTPSHILMYRISTRHTSYGY